MNDPHGRMHKAELEDFILSLPDFGLTIKKSKVVPSFSVINELLRLGKSDSGMSGCFEWEPIQIELHTYTALRDSLNKKLGSDAVEFDDDKLSLKQWMSLARSHFSNKRGQ